MTTTDTKIPSDTGPIFSLADRHEVRTANEAGRRSGGGICGCSQHENWNFLPNLLTTMAFILSTYAHFSCRFIKREVTVSDAKENDTTFSAFTLGLWSFMDPNIYGLCFRYPSNINFDPYFETARAMAPLSAILGGLVMLSFWFGSCIGMTKEGWRFCSFVLILTTLFEGLTLLIFKSDFCKEHDEGLLYSCKLSTGANLTIASIVMYFVAALCVCCTKNPRGNI
eukprot:136368_1